MKVLAKCDVPDSKEGVVLRHSAGQVQPLFTHQYQIDKPGAHYQGHYYHEDEMHMAFRDFLDRVESLLARCRKE